MIIISAVQTIQSLFVKTHCKAIKLLITHVSQSTTDYWQEYIQSVQQVFRHANIKLH